jgi:hypothetical protein
LGRKQKAVHAVKYNIGKIISRTPCYELKGTAPMPVRRARASLFCKQANLIRAVSGVESFVAGEKQYIEQEEKGSFMLERVWQRCILCQ